MQVYVAIPSYSGTVRVECVSSIVPSLAALCERGIPSVLQFIPSNCFIDLTRNLIVSNFLKSDCSHLLFIDNDVTFPADAITKLLDHDLDLVGAAYPLRQDGVHFPVRIAHAQPFGALIECEGIPTGFMLIKRSLIERMIAAYPERKFKELTAPDEHYELFSSGPVDGVFWGEDYRFCQLATAIGTRIWCDTSIEMTHIGTKEYKADFKDWLVNRGRSGAIDRSGVAA